MTSAPERFTPENATEGQPPQSSPPGAGSIDAIARLVAHAVNNPLAALVMDLELATELLEAERGEGAWKDRSDLTKRVQEARRLLGEARSAADRLRRVVDELRRIPTAADAVRILSSEPSLATLKPPPPAAPSVARLLVVDDDALVANAVKRTLRNHDVVVLASAQEAIARFEAGERYDVILCDLMMPELTGMDLYDALILIAPDQAKRMVFVTGGAVTTRARDFVASTPNEVVEKPFDVSKLREVIARSLKTMPSVPRMAAAGAAAAESSGAGT